MENIGSIEKKMIVRMIPSILHVDELPYLLFSREFGREVFGDTHSLFEVARGRTFSFVGVYVHVVYQHVIYLTIGLVFTGRMDGYDRRQIEWIFDFTHEPQFVQ